jgi:hypothetical protein
MTKSVFLLNLLEGVEPTKEEHFKHREIIYAFS